jgi:hypothetical protein
MAAILLRYNIFRAIDVRV